MKELRGKWNERRRKITENDKEELKESQNEKVKEYKNKNKKNLTKNGKCKE